MKRKLTAIVKQDLFIIINSYYFVVQLLWSIKVECC